jgi:hypothetical protein
VRSARAWSLLWRSLHTGAACFGVTVGVLGSASERVVLGFWAVGVVVTAVGEWARARWSRTASEAVTVVQPEVRDERVVVFKRRDPARDTKPDASPLVAKPEAPMEVMPAAVAEGGRRRRRRAAKSPASATAGGQA